MSIAFDVITYPAFVISDPDVASAAMNLIGLMKGNGTYGIYHN